MLADGGQDFMHDPPLEGFGFRFARTQDEGIQARLGNDGCSLLPARGVQNVDTLFVFIQKGQACARIAKPQYLRHVLGHEPRFPVNQQAAQDGPGDRFPELVRLVIVGG